MSIEYKKVDKVTEAWQNGIKIGTWEEGHGEYGPKDAESVHMTTCKVLKKQWKNILESMYREGTNHE